jgi:dTDP-4-dehydrorhamnose 3,5-epimerase
MNLLPTRIAGVFRVQLEPRGDQRGYFARVFDIGKMHEVDPRFQIVQINRSLTQAKGTIRGLHFQRAPHAEDKLVQCLRGAIFDVAVDIRPNSPTYRQWVGQELSAENKELLLVPKGCAHGFQTLTADCLVEYFVSESYAPLSEGGILWSDPAVGVAWPLGQPTTSEKDAAWPLLGP